MTDRKFEKDAHGGMAEVLRELGSRVMIVQRDCGGLPVRQVDIHDQWFQPGSLVGRTAGNDIVCEKTGEVLVALDAPVDQETLSRLQGFEEHVFLMRSLLTCRSLAGRCALCYGLGEDGKFPELGAPIGTWAATSLLGSGLTPDMIDLLAYRVEGAAVQSVIDGRVAQVGAGILVEGDDSGVSHLHAIPQGREIIVREGHRVLAGDPLTSGPLDPGEIMRIQGVSEAQEYLLTALKQAFRGGRHLWNERAAEIFVWIMTGWARIEAPGSTFHRPGDLVWRESLSGLYSQALEVSRAAGEPLFEVPRLEPVVLGLETVLGEVLPG
jgi:DNA-directed RNA polymerase subunit beta'